MNNLENKIRAAIRKVVEDDSLEDELTMELLKVLAPSKVSENVYIQYEREIGPLTPMISDTLTDAEKEYGEEWINDAIRIAAQNNKRSLSYVMAILRNRQENGSQTRYNGRNGNGHNGKRKDYTGGEFAEYIKH